MNTFSSAFTWLGSIIVFTLCPVMLFLIFRRKLYRRLIFFTTYLIVLLIWSVVLGWVSRTPFFNAPAWFDIYWATEFSLSVLRLLTIGEISRRFLKEYPAIWAFASWLLLGIATALLLWTINSAIHNIHHVRRFILVGDQRFECMQAVLLITLLAIGAYYRIRLPSLYHLILIGIGIYSSIQIANNPLGINQKILPNSIFDYVRRGSIMVSLPIWTYAIWQQPAAQEPKPPLISQAAYDSLSPEVHERLQDLNKKLADLLHRRS